MGRGKSLSFCMCNCNFRRPLFGHTFGGLHYESFCSAFCHFSFFIHLSIQHLSFSFWRAFELLLFVFCSQNGINNLLISKPISMRCLLVPCDFSFCYANHMPTNMLAFMLELFEFKYYCSSFDSLAYTFKHYLCCKIVRMVRLVL